MSLLITNGKVYTNGRFIEANLLIEKGKIAKITTEKPSSQSIISAKGKIVIPGVIDPHVHFREPGLTHKEDFTTGSRAAAKGGVTTVLDMPNTLPPVTTAEALTQKRAIISQKSIVNFGLHFGAAQDNLKEIKRAKNIPSVKVYCDHTTGNLKIDDLSILEGIYNTVPTTCLHAEGENVRKTLSYLTNAKGNAYLCHTSSAKELHFARENPSLRTRIFVEVTPQHLFLTSDDIKRLGAFAEMKPRLKEKSDQRALWEGVLDGSVDTIGTDHAPHTVKEKCQHEFPFGIPGVETSLPLMLNAVNEKRLSISRLINLMCENPARIFRLKGKGAIAQGMDADLTIIDLNEKKKVVNEELQTKCKWSPWDGKLLKGWPHATIVNGTIAFNDGEFTKKIAKEVTYG